MNPDLDPWRWSGCFLLVLTLAGIVHSLMANQQNVIWKHVRVAAIAYDRDLRFLRIAWNGVSIIFVQFGLSIGILICGALLSQPILWTCIIGVLLLPSRLLARKRIDRVVRIERLLDHWLQVLANNVRADGALGEALRHSAQSVPAPLADELEDAFKAYRLGTPLNVALEQMGARVGSRKLRGCLTTLCVARQTGGELPTMLEAAASAQREAARIDGILRTKTAEGRAQATLISAMPLPLFGAVHLIDPTYFRPLMELDLGKLVICLVVTLWLVAILWIRRILVSNL